jgi:hypothetical protein
VRLFHSGLHKRRPYSRDGIFNREPHDDPLWLRCCGQPSRVRHESPGPIGCFVFLAVDGLKTHGRINSRSLDVMDALRERFAARDPCFLNRRAAHSLRHNMAPIVGGRVLFHENETNGHMEKPGPTLVFPPACVYILLLNGDRPGRNVLCFNQLTAAAHVRPRNSDPERRGSAPSRGI